MTAVELFDERLVTNEQGEDVLGGPQMIPQFMIANDHFALDSFW
jgi:hypothetical protein